MIRAIRAKSVWSVAVLMAATIAPSADAALVLHLDASDHSSVLNTSAVPASQGDSVGTWVDLAGGDQNATALVSNPTYNAIGGPLGQPAIDFVTAPGSNLVTGPTQALTIAMVHRWDTANSGSPSYLFDGRNNIANSYVWQGGFGPNWTAYVNNSTTPAGSVASVRNDAWQITTFVGTSAGTDALHLFSRFTNNEFGLGSLAEVRVFDTALTESERLAVVDELNTKWFTGTPPVGPKLITPTSVNVQASSQFFPAGNLINNSGLSGTPNLGNYTGVTHADSSAANAWVTDAFFPDYYTGGGVVPVMDFALDDLYDLTDLVAWNYSIPGNAARQLTLEFSEDGGLTFGNPLILEVPQAAGPEHTLNFGQSVLANAVRVSFDSNWVGFGAGGDRVGLAELKFIGTPAAAIPEPTSVALLLLAGAALGRRKRRAA